jgi:hypothetical protein
MNEILIVDKNSKLLLSYKEWEDIIVNERLKIETDWNKLVIIVDADIAEWNIKTDWKKYYEDWKAI